MQSFTGQSLRRMAGAALAALERERGRIDSLNVFPVPDGDTGTNMALTLRAAIEGISSPNGALLSDTAEELAALTLRGARGNSGTILSQFFHGFFLGVAHLAEASALQVAQALDEAAKAAYQAVAEPQEGTMLTVGRAAADAALEAANQGNDVTAVFEAALHGATTALARTPEQLPILKEAGVVDAGGEGLVVAVRAALEALRDPQLDWTTATLGSVTDSHDLPTKHVIEATDITYTYCTEFLVHGESIDLARVQTALEPLGDSIIVVGSPTLTKVHLHTNHPGRALEIGCQWGFLSSISVDNMQEQNRVLAADANESTSDVPAVVAVAWGAGFEAILSAHGAKEIVTVNSTLKPSAGQLLEAIERTASGHIILLPAHQDVLFAAQQAASLTEKNVVVLPATTSPAAVSALLRFDETQSFDDNVQAMQEGIEEVRVAQVTVAARSTTLQGVEVQQGEFIAMVDGRLVSAHDDLYAAVHAALKSLEPTGDSLVTLYYGEPVSSDVAQAHAQCLEEELVDVGCEFEVYEGGQKTYHYWIAIE